MREVHRRERGVIYFTGIFGHISRPEDFEGWRPYRYRRPQKPTMGETITARLIELFKLPNIETLEVAAFEPFYKSERPWHIVEDLTASIELEGWLAVYGAKRVSRRAHKLAYDADHKLKLVPALRLQPNSFARRKVLGYIATKRFNEENVCPTPPLYGGNGVYYTSVDSNELLSSPDKTITIQSTEEGTLLLPEGSDSSANSIGLF